MMWENEESEVIRNGMRKIQVICKSKQIFHYKFHVNSVRENTLSPWETQKKKKKKKITLREYNVELLHIKSRFSTA